ncbi:MAG: hypothetical protein EBZ77_04735 [Chitinophagia bacterium]|nr:hypothetical protein [Chitinophagia bacterium]
MPGEKSPIDIPPNHIVVDPAGLPYITGDQPISGAGTLSGAIYAHYHVKDQFRPGPLLSKCTEFPRPVFKDVTAEGHAFAYEYVEGTVIHVVGPNFDESPENDMNDAVVRLAAAYASVVRAAEAHVRGVIKYNESNAYKKGAVVRLPLISMGKFAGSFQGEQKYELTARAVTEALLVKPPKSTNDLGIQYWLCLYNSSKTSEYRGYVRALERAKEALFSY